MTIDGNTKKFGILGNPVSHSLSPAMHNSGFRSLGMNAVYLPFEVVNIEGALSGVRSLGIDGLSVTIPHKQAAMPFLDTIDPVAEKIGAVNTIKVIREGGEVKLHGLNTDWIGANRALELKISLKGKKTVILGAGGAARAIGFGLQEAGGSIEICSRTEESGRALAADLECDWYPLSALEDLSADILINGTSVGMHPHENKSIIARKLLVNYQVVMDIVYAPLNTKLLQEADEVGCMTVNGLEMLLYQGVEQFEIWTGEKAPVEIMREVLMRATDNA